MWVFIQTCKVSNNKEFSKIILLLKGHSQKIYSPSYIYYYILLWKFLRNQATQCLQWFKDGWLKLISL